MRSVFELAETNLLMQARWFLLFGALCLPVQSHAGDVRAEVNHFVTFLKRLCVDGDLSVEVAQRQWKANAEKDSEFRGNFYPSSEFGPARIVYFGSSLFDTPIGKEHYTLSAESPPDGQTFVWCDFHGVFSSVDAALSGIEAALSLKGRQQPHAGLIEWAEDNHPNLKFSAKFNDPISDQPGSFIIEVSLEPLMN